MVRALVYTRQSVEKDGGERSLSLDSQVDTLSDRCQREGWSVVAIIREAGYRGWMDADDRPGLSEALSRADAGEYDIFLVWDLSRLARSVWVQEGIVRRLRAAGVDLVSHTEPHAANAMMRQIFGAVHEEKTRDLSITMRRVIHHRMGNGLHFGRVPWGYVRPAPKAALAIDEIPSGEIWNIYEQRARGTSPAAIARDLASRHIPTPDNEGGWTVQAVCRILRCPTYRGAVRAGDGWLEDAHPAIVPADLWRRAQEGNGRRAPRQKTVTSWLEGHIEHACGHPMYLMQPSTRADRPGYVRGAHFRCRVASRGVGDALRPSCTFSPRNMLASRAEALVWQTITDDLARVRHFRHVVADARRRYRAMTPVSEAAHREALERKSRAVARRSRAEDLYLSGDRDRAWFDAEDARAAMDVAEAERQLAHIPAPPDPALFEAQWERLRRLRDALGEYGPEERGAVLHVLGVAVVQPVGRRDGSGDVGCVTIRYRDDLADFFRWGSPGS